MFVMRRDIRNNDVEVWNPMHGDPYYFKREEIFFSCFQYIKLNKHNILDLEKSDSEYPLQEIGKHY